MKKIVSFYSRILSKGRQNIFFRVISTENVFASFKFLIKFHHVHGQNNCKIKKVKLVVINETSTHEATQKRITKHTQIFLLFGIEGGQRSVNAAFPEFLHSSSKNESLKSFLYNFY